MCVMSIPVISSLGGPVTSTLSAYSVSQSLSSFTQTAYFPTGKPKKLPLLLFLVPIVLFSIKYSILPHPPSAIIAIEPLLFS